MNPDVAAVAGSNVNGETFVPLLRITYESRWLMHSGAGVTGGEKQDLVESGAVDMKSGWRWKFADLVRSIPTDDCRTGPKKSFCFDGVAEPEYAELGENGPGQRLAQPMAWKDSLFNYDNGVPQKRQSARSCRSVRPSAQNADVRLYRFHARTL